MVCFGVLPAVTVYMINQHNTISLVLSSLYILCALIRLAFFNVDEQERQSKTSDSREVYYGLPVTMSALILPIVYSVTYTYTSIAGRILSITLLLMSILFLLPFKLRKPKIYGKVCIILCGIIEILIVATAFVEV